MQKRLFFALLIIISLVFSACSGMPEGDAGPVETPEPGVSDPAPDEVPADEPSPPPAPEPGEKRKESGARESEAGEELMLMEDAASMAAPDARTGGGSSYGAAERPSESGLSAGYADDNEQYGYFLSFLDEYSQARHLELDVSERIVLRLSDADGKSVPNADIRISAAGRPLIQGRTTSEGEFLFFPRAYGDMESGEFSLDVRSSAGDLTRTIARDGLRTLDLKLSRSRRIPDPPEVDILFVLDTTGSMGEEIERLKTTIELIHLNLSSMPAAPAIRFGLVLYKDVGDEYRTQAVPLTADLEEFQAALAPVYASGGGDTPEDLQQALHEGINGMAWNEEGIRLVYVITDAPPQLDYEDTPPYPETLKAAQTEGIRIYSVGTGGLPLDGEYVLRQMAQFTGGRYIFLTYGEQGESEGGAPGSVSHHTGANFQTDKLESIIIRFTKEEIGHLTDKPLEEPEPYFTAAKIESEEREETLAKLFGEAIEQLADFSTIALDADFRIAVLPVEAKNGASRIQAEYFTERLVLAAGESERFALVERQDLQAVLEELELQLSGLTSGEGAAELGELLNARGLAAATLFENEEGFELFLRLIRVETGEVLSVTRMRIDRALGL